MWTCPKCGEKIEEQFDVCWKCAARAQPAGEMILTARVLRFFFLLGLVFELLVVLLGCTLPESSSGIAVRNFVIVTHAPLLLVTDGLRIGDGPLSLILSLLAGLALMGALWGCLIYLAARAVRAALDRLAFSRRQKKFLWRAVAFSGLLGVAATVIANLPATPIPFAASPEVNSVVAGNNAFALDLYQQLKARPGNLFFSPFSISTALAMTYAGARGQTGMEMSNALHFRLPPEKMHPAFRALAGRMDRIQRWHRIVLKTVNALWRQQDYPFRADFVRLIRENYFAEAKSVNFTNAGGAAAEINRWIDRKTDHKITGGIEPGQLTPDTRLVLSDAIYFKGKWQHQFKARDTKPAPFHVTTNQTVTVPMMYQKEHFKTAFNDDYSVELLELPYAGTDLSMIVLLPSGAEYYFPDAGPNDVYALEQKLTVANLRTWLKKLDQADPRETWVALPRFTTTQRYDLVSELKALGMASAFNDESADFSGMDGTTNLFVSDVIHQAFVNVDESGTEAAAVSLVLAKTKGMANRFLADHPFIFLIRENGSGSVLFLGRIIDPTK